MRRPSAYRVFLTRNSEYHVRAGTCFGVRDRRTGQWLERHVALGRPLANSYADAKGGLRTGTVPMIGDPLTFVVEEQSVTTTAVLAIENRDALPTASRHERLFSRHPRQSPRETY